MKFSIQDFNDWRCHDVQSIIKDRTHQCNYKWVVVSWIYIKSHLDVAWSIYTYLGIHSSLPNKSIHLAFQARTRSPSRPSDHLPSWSRYQYHSTLPHLAWFWFPHGLQLLDAIHSKGVDVRMKRQEAWWMTWIRLYDGTVVSVLGLTFSAGYVGDVLVSSSLTLNHSSRSYNKESQIRVLRVAQKSSVKTKKVRRCHGYTSKENLFVSCCHTVHPSIPCLLSLIGLTVLSWAETWWGRSKTFPIVGTSVVGLMCLSVSWRKPFSFLHVFVVSVWFEARRTDVIVV